MFRNFSIGRSMKAVCTIALMFACTYIYADSFTQTDLVSNVPGMAVTTDPNLKNPWGVSFSATSPFWVSNQASGNSTLYNGAGAITPLVVTIPPSATPPSGPTGTVFNSSTGFKVGTAASNFIFDTLNGTIAAWNSSAGTTAVVMASTPGAVYTGLTQNTSGGSSFLYAASATGSIHVFDSNWNDVTSSMFSGKFVDPNLPAGFTPFNIQTIGSNLYVTYSGASGGFVDEYDTNGNFIKRIASGGALFSPWGLTIAPANFGSFSNDLLVGNFGNGEILAYDPNSDAFLGTLDGPDGQPLVNDFLWALETRTGGVGDNPNAVYFTAGIDNQQDGLFGELTVATPEPSTIFGTGSGLIALALIRLRSRLKFLR